MFYTNSLCAVPEDDPKRVETWSCNIFVVNYIYSKSVHFVGVVLCNYRMFIGPCIIIIVEELETNLMSLVIFITLNICSTCFEH